MVSHRPLPLAKVNTSLLLAHQHTPQDFDHYIAARTSLWQSDKATHHQP